MQIAMIECYLRANNMFVDHTKVSYAYNKC